MTRIRGERMSTAAATPNNYIAHKARAKGKKPLSLLSKTERSGADLKVGATRMLRPLLRGTSSERPQSSRNGANVCATQTKSKSGMPKQVPYSHLRTLLYWPVFPSRSGWVRDDKSWTWLWCEDTVAVARNGDSTRQNARKRGKVKGRGEIL